MKLPVLYLSFSSILYFTFFIFKEKEFHGGTESILRKCVSKDNLLCPELFARTQVKGGRIRWRGAGKSRNTGDRKKRRSMRFHPESGEQDQIMVMDDNQACHLLSSTLILKNTLD